ncbi:MAG: sugar transferase [Sphingosinicella sp.]
MFRSLTIFPGIKAGSYILPAFSISYGLVLFVFWAFRIDYSRFLFLTGFAVCLAWHLLIFFLSQRAQSLRIGVVPFGEVELLQKITTVEWVPLTKPRLVKRKSVEAIVADFQSHLPDEWERFLADAALSGVTVYHVKQLRESLTGRVQIDHLSENNFGSLIPALMYVKLKRAVDLACALPAAILLTPALLMIGLLIRMDSPGPALFRQRRVGAGGASFQVIKFRTMKHDSSIRSPDGNALRHAMTQENDLRITRLGRFLRRSRIDELPQVFNIIMGQMSWIGPRPEAEVLSEWYESELPFYRYRHIVKPGITGWAQVNQGHVSEVEDVFGKLQYDFYYIKNFSPWLDILIAMRTIAIIATGRGSR